ncbi:beta-ketoacyl-ACP synthase III [Hyphomicrobium sp.]|uniref:beta-ketoacyl-ACP synthase III n=1 Tax=Hyphomicrobium sp. TaxID=82 RepID=UPI002E31362F|nr:beta-ketoacyl-ACP synthase III [Hyphomicrobium sp.]HEX2840967.1 beta-ketoacyl-ACP synthase III [Hyphomicrobium sp.]
MGSALLALGHYAPERRVTNAEIEARLGVEAGWSERRTGIVERRFAAPDEALSDLAAKAGEMALARAGIDRSTIGLLVLATSTPDHLLPPSAPLVAHQLGMTGSGAIDMAGACGGFLYALTFAESFVRLNRAPALVIAANILSRRLNLNDPKSALLFGDGAGAALLVPSERANSGVRGVHLASDGSAYDLIQIPAGGSRRPFKGDLDPTATLMHIKDGRAVFTRAVKIMTSAAQAALARAGLDLEDIDFVVPHQANARIIGAVQRQLGVPDEKMISTVALFANSSAATIPLSLSIASEQRAFKPGERLLLTAAGAGLTGGAVVFEV